jgi:hypothetical protein
MERNSKLVHEAMSCSPLRMPKRMISVDRNLPIVVDDVSLYSSQRINSFHNEAWPQGAASLKVPAALESPFLWFSPDRNTRRAQIPLGHQKAMSSLSFTFAELQGMGNGWASHQQKTTHMATNCGNDFVDMPAWYSSHYHNVSALSDDILSCKVHSRDVSVLSFNYEMDESDDSLAM